MDTMDKILFVMIGGSLGALSRYGVSLLAVKLFGTKFPYGTLIVNLAGCFLIGMAFSMSDRGSSLMTPSIRLFFVTGYLGALTTFSTFAMETVSALRQESILAALPNLLLNNVSGIALVFLGIWVGQMSTLMEAVLKIQYVLQLLGHRMGLIP